MLPVPKKEKIDDIYKLQPSVAVDKKDAEARAAIELDCEVNDVKGKYDNRLVLVKLVSLSTNITNIRAAGGFFYEYVSSDLESLKGIVNEKYQAVGVYGISTKVVADYVIENGLHGIDRIRQIGHLADFELTWDGYDLIRTLSREIVC